MGLFDMFGAGGGSLAIQAVSTAVAPGQTLMGNVVFQGGKRAQQINALTIRVTQETRQMEMTNQGPQPRSNTRDIIPSTSIAQPFMSTPDQPTTIPFQLPMPQGLQNTTPNVVMYRISVAADIPGEVDPGKTIDIQVVGGIDVQQQMPQQGMQPGMMQPGMMQPGMMQPGMMQPGMMQPGMMQQQQGMMPQQGMMQPGMQQPGMMVGQIQIASGTRVNAVWAGNGQLNPGTVRGFENGMYNIDWEDARLGASSYVYPQQIQVLTGAPGFGHNPQAKHVDPHAKHVDPHAKHVDPHAKHVDPNAKQADPYGKQADPYAQHGKQADPYAQHGKQQHDPHAKQVDHHAKQTVSAKHDPNAKQVHAQVGAHVTAQHANGQWYPGRIVQMQNGMIGVDWDDASLGQSSWVHAHQVR